MVCSFQSSATAKHNFTYPVADYVAKAMLQTCMQHPQKDIHDEILLSSGRENPVRLEALVLKPSAGLFCTALWRVTIPCGAYKDRVTDAC